MPDEFELQIYLARHGESLGNLAFAQGGGQDQQTQADKHDPELTPRGRTQAVLLGERLSRERFDAIFSSSLVRAVSTAHEVSIRQPGGAVPVEVLRDLAETGTPWSYIGYPLDALIYILISEKPQNKPSAFYYSTLLEGYRAAGFDTKILKVATEGE